MPFSTEYSTSLKTSGIIHFSEIKGNCIAQHSFLMLPVLLAVAVAKRDVPPPLKVSYSSWQSDIARQVLGVQDQLFVPLDHNISYIIYMSCQHICYKRF